MSAPTAAERSQWRNEAEALAEGYGGTCDDHDYDRILRLLDALEAAEARPARAEMPSAETLAEWRQRAEFWTTRHPSVIGHLYDRTAVAFAGEVLALIDALAEAAAQAWDEAVAECHDLGWLHDFAKSDALARNPYHEVTA